MRDMWDQLKKGGARDDIHPNDQGSEAWFIVLVLPFILVLLAVVFVVLLGL
ncbi:MAG: hypothetical protein AAF488_07020 [Planctomycetota bacterium]